MPNYKYLPVHLSLIRSSSDPRKQSGWPSHNLEMSYSWSTSVDSFTWQPKYPSSKWRKKISCGCFKDCWRTAGVAGAEVAGAARADAAGRFTPLLLAGRVSDLAVWVEDPPPGPGPLPLLGVFRPNPADIYNNNKTGSRINFFFKVLIIIHHLNPSVSNPIHNILRAWEMVYPHGQKKRLQSRSVKLLKVFFFLFRVGATLKKQGSMTSALTCVMSKRMQMVRSSMPVR